MAYRSPALTGDLTYLDGEVTAIDHEGPLPIATIHVTMSNQRAEVMALGDAEVRLPTESLPVL